MLPVFTRRLSLISKDGTESPVNVVFGPFHDRDDGFRGLWLTIEGLWETPFRLDVSGSDDVQAVQLALRAAGAKIGATPEFQAGRLYYLAQDIGHGFC